MKKINMNVLIINSVCGTGSTGRICEGIAKEYEEQGAKVRIAYGRASGSVPNEAEEHFGYRIGNDWDIRAHGMITRLYDLHGFGSRNATKHFLEWADEYDPDLLWLHNIHGYYVNIEELFLWIKARQRRQKEQGKKIMEVRWTLHDCWAFTGHCSHFTYVGCNKWKTGCDKCPQKRDYPGSLLLERSDLNYRIKRKLFIGVKELTIVTPSHWLERLVNESYLGCYPVEVIHNKIDENVFKPIPSDFKKRYGIEDKTMLLGVSGVWNNRKGLRDFIELSRMLDDSYRIVLVGVSEQQAKNLKQSTSIIPLLKTEDQRELAEIYSAADIFLNLSKEETFGLTTLEALCCGTKVIVYKDTACEEVLEKYGKEREIVVEQDVDSLYQGIVKVTNETISR